MAEDPSSRKHPSAAAEVDLTADGTSLEEAETSTDAVTREAEALLNGTDERSGDHRPTDDLVADVERTLDLVDALVDEASLRGSSPDPDSSSDVETAPADLDLTVTLPEAPVDPEDQVPAHGAEGPSVDLFAQPEPDPAAVETPAANPRLIFEEDRRSGPTPDSRSASLPEEDALVQAMTDEFGSAPTELPAMSEPEKTLEQPAARRRSSRDAAASRLQDLLTARLAEEYDSVEEIGGRSPSVEESIGEETVNGPAVIESIASEETIDRPKEGPLATADVGGVNVLPDASAFDLEESSAVEQEATLEFIEPAPSSAASKIVKDAESTPPSAPESSEASSPIVTDVPDLPDSEIASSPSDGSEDVETPPVVESESSSPVAAPVAPEAAEDAGEVASEAPEVAASQGTPSPSAPEPEPEPEPESEPEPEPASTEAIGSEEDRETECNELEPGLLSRLATPLALSLVAWVPLVWGYALMAPAPDPTATEVLSVGISASTVDPTTEPGEPTEPGSTPPSTD